jgi:hypothetical protein
VANGKYGGINMNAYRIDMWRSVKHNGVWVTTVSRTEIIHARNEKEARSKIILKEAYVNNLPQLKIETGNEFINSCEKIGTVTIEPFYVYSGQNYNYSPISVEDYKAKYKNDRK